VLSASFMQLEQTNW